MGESYATGTVSGDWNVGGLVGWLDGGTIDASYATTDVDGDDGVGGSVGWMVDGAVSDSYAVGAVTSDGTAGGLVGAADGGDVTESNWDRETTTQDVSGGSHESFGLTTVEMLGQEATENMALSFDSSWEVLAEDGAVSYPYLGENPQEPAPGYEERFAGGDGTEDAPYEVETWHHLENVRLSLEANYVLAADLDSETEGYDDVAGGDADDGAGFAPIGDDDEPFAGTFDGDEHTIANVTIDRDQDDVGFFGVNDGAIERVGLEAVTVSGNQRVGGLVGDNSGDVNQSYATGSVTGTGWDLGGLTGSNDETGTLDRSYANVTTEGETRRVGGLVGTNYGEVDQSYATGSVTGDREVGGLAGANSGDDAEVYRSYATGSVSGEERNVGGLVGLSSGEVDQSYATGSVSGEEENVGGLVGIVNTNGEVYRSYATGSVTGEESHVGGLVGENREMVNQSYATGMVTGEGPDVGGLVGLNDQSSDASVIDSYWDRRSTGQASSDGSLSEYGLFTHEMTGPEAQSNMNFSFSSLFIGETWNVVDDDLTVSYPYLEENQQEPAPGVQERFAGGDGSESDPYQIETWRQLDTVRMDLEANYTLVADLDEETEGYDEIASASANNGSGFDPIGIGNVERFKGTFDGDGHTIANLTAERGFTTGLVTINEGTIRNVTLVDANLSGVANVGGVAGINNGVVEYVSSDGTFNGTPGVGTLVGMNGEDGEIVDSSGSGTVEGDTYATYVTAGAGGLVGDNSGSVEASSANATVIADEHEAVGGLVGSNDGGTVLESTASGTVVGDEFVGGLVGNNEDGGEVTEAFSTGTVYGEKGVGGLVGTNDASVSDTYATGDVYGSESVGGLVGSNENDATVSAAYTTVDVSGNDRTGGFAGENDGSIEGGYWDGEDVTDSSLDGVGSGDGDGVTELDTDQLTGHDASSHLNGLDFVPESTWATIHDDYPVLAWEVDILDVATIDPEETTVDAGESVPVTATVNNPEPVETDGTVELRLEDDPVATVEVELELSGDETVTFDGGDAIDTDGLEGEYTYTVATDTDQANGTLTVGPGSGEPQLGEYTNDDDVVETDGLRDAIDDWRSGVIDTDLLRDVIDAWRSGDPVD